MALGSPKLHSGCSWQLQHIVLLIASLLTSTANGYTGFDCGQGEAWCRAAYSPTGWSAFVSRPS